MRTTIYFIRHGDVHNPNDIWYGRLPRMSLSKEGKLRVQKTADFLKNKEVSIIYSSSLLRARQSAQIIAQTLNHRNPKVNNKLLEIKSHVQGMPFSYIKEIKANFFADDIRQADDESISDISDRMWKYCLQMSTMHNGANIVAVSHGDPLMILGSYVSNGYVTFESIRPGPEKYIKYGEIYKIILEDNKVIDYLSIYKPEI